MLFLYQALFSIHYCISVDSHWCIVTPGKTQPQNLYVLHGDFYVDLDADLAWILPFAVHGLGVTATSTPTTPPGQWVEAFSFAEAENLSCSWPANIVISLHIFRSAIRGK